MILPIWCATASSREAMPPDAQRITCSLILMPKVNLDRSAGRARPTGRKRHRVSWVWLPPTPQALRRGYRTRRRSVHFGRADLENHIKPAIKLPLVPLLRCYPGGKNDGTVASSSVSTRVSVWMQSSSETASTDAMLRGASCNTLAEGAEAGGE